MPHTCGSFPGRILEGGWVKTPVLDPALPLTSGTTLGKFYPAPEPHISNTLGIQWSLTAFPALTVYVHGNLQIANSLFWHFWT